MRVGGAITRSFVADPALFMLTHGLGDADEQKRVIPSVYIVSSCNPLPCLLSLEPMVARYSHRGV